jgi:hypothetical protein
MSIRNEGNIGKYTAQGKVWEKYVEGRILRKWQL